MSKDIVISVKGEPGDAALVVANIFLLFRKLGVHPQLVSPTPAGIMRLGADEWGTGGALQRLCQDPEIKVVLQDNPGESKRPYVGAIGVVRKGKKILMGKRVKEDPAKTKYGFPGGKVEAGESLEVALVRELREEVGLDVEAGEIITAGQPAPGHNVGVIMWAKQKDSMQRPMASAEVADPKFYTIAEAEKLDVGPHTAAVLKIIKTQFAAEAAAVKSE